MSDNLSIAMFGQKRVPSRDGGVEIVVEELSTRMVKKGHMVTCFNRYDKRVQNKKYDDKKEKQYKGVKIKDVFTINCKGLAAMTSSFFASLQAALGHYDVVHIHAEGPAFFSFIPRVFRKKVIVTVHGLDWRRAKWGRFASWYIKMGERNAVRYADEIIVLSQATRDYFLQEYKRKTNFIPNGVKKSEKVEAKEIKKWGLEKNNYVLFLGRIVPEKGLEYLVEAWKRVKTDKRLVIAGGSSDTDGFVKKLKAISGDANFIGFVQGRELEELYSNCFIYCLPSDLEGMPLSLLEAMSYGSCCLVSDIEECASVVGEKGVLFQRGNVDELAGKLQWLCDNPKIVEKYQKQAAEYICRKYNWDDVVNKTLKLYK